MKIAKKTSTFLFAPINTILALPYLGNLLNKIKQEKLKEYDFKKKLIIFAVILLLAVIIEKSYIKSFEMGLIKNAIK
jgi:hypothetical protein